MTNLEIAIKAIEHEINKRKRSIDTFIIPVPTTNEEVIAIFKKGIRNKDINSLNNRNLEIAFKRYGLNGYVKKTYIEMATEYQLTPSRLYQIVRDVLKQSIHITRYYLNNPDKVPN